MKLPEESKGEWFIFKICENCKKVKFKWLVKYQRIYIIQLKQWVTGRLKICGKCRKVVEEAIKERHV